MAYGKRSLLVLSAMPCPFILPLQFILLGLRLSGVASEVSDDEIKKARESRILGRWLRRTCRTRLTGSCLCACVRTSVGKLEPKRPGLFFLAFTGWVVKAGCARPSKRSTRPSQCCPPRGKSTTAGMRTCRRFVVPKRPGLAWIGHTWSWPELQDKADMFATLAARRQDGHTRASTISLLF